MIPHQRAASISDPPGDVQSDYRGQQEAERRKWRHVEKRGEQSIYGCQHLPCDESGYAEHEYPQ
jgi:hypothetical protein